MKLQRDTHIVALDNNATTTTISSINNHQQHQDYYPTQSPAVSNNDSDVRDLLASLGRRKWFIAGITGLMALISILISLSMTPVYRAQATIKIDPDEKQIVDFGVSATKGYQESKEYMQTQYKLLKSRALARRVIDSLDLESALISSANDKKAKPFYADFVADLKEKIKSKKDNNVNGGAEQVNLPPAELSFLRGLTVEPVGKSQLVNIYYQAKDPKVASAIVNSLTTNFIKMNIDGRVNAAEDAKRLLREQLVLVKSRLQESEARLVKHEREKGIINIGNNNSLIADSLEVINRAYAEARKLRIDAEAEYRQRQKSSGAIRSLDNQVIQHLKADLQKLRSKYQENLLIYKPGYPLMRELQNQIRTTQVSLNRELKLVKSGAHQDLKTRWIAASQREKELKKELSREKSRLLDSRDRSLGHNTLQREVQTNRELYEGLLQRMKEVGVAGGVGTNNVSIVDTAYNPFTKYKPNTKLNLIIGILLGLMTGGLLALLLEHADDRIKSVEDLKKLTELPVLGIFPNIKVPGQKKNQRQAVLVTEQTSSAIAEAFRSLRTNMLFATPEGVPKLLHLTSSSSGEGKSNTAINLSIVFAQSGKSVLIIDADLRKPSLHKYLKLNNTAGLSNYISGDASISEIETNTNVSGLTAITAGSFTANPADFLSSNRMLDLLKQAADAYDLVIIDSPPVMGLADALVLSNRSTATLFVVASHETEKKHILGAIERLKMGYGNVIGFVLTKAREGKKSGYGYDYDYGDTWQDNNNVARLELK
ncbi:MAG: polysaccharide biosynthesis tyrosine autokinase [Thiotrichaceae bacterium]